LEYSSLTQAILNFLRTGSLHIPSYVCGPAAKNELAYWGINDRELARCCWNNYNSWNSTLDALNQLERDLKGHDATKVKDHDDTRWGKWQLKISALLNNPKSSISAMVSLQSELLGHFRHGKFTIGTTRSFPAMVCLLSSAVW
jgi:hypothetical protein